MAGQRQHDGGGKALRRPARWPAPARRRAAAARSARAGRASRRRRRAPARCGCRPARGIIVMPSRRMACGVGPRAGPPDGEQRLGRRPPGGATMASTSPPRPHRCGPTTAIAVPVATAASAAEPPWASMPRPADAASWSAAATMPRSPVRGPKGARGRAMASGIARASRAVRAAEYRCDPVSTSARRCRWPRQSEASQEGPVGRFEHGREEQARRQGVRLPQGAQGAAGRCQRTSATPWRASTRSRA